MSDDNEYIDEYTSINFNELRVKKGKRLEGGCIELNVLTNSKEPVYFAMPVFRIGDELNISSISKNGFLKLDLDYSNDKHTDFKEFLKELDEWTSKTVIRNFDEWFGHQWRKGGCFYGKNPIAKSTLKKMHQPLLNESAFTVRVHQKKQNYVFEYVDTEQNDLDRSTLNNCYVVPLVELKTIFMKSNGYNVDLVLRGLVRLTDEEYVKSIEDEKNETLFSQDEENNVNYTDYATDDETLASEYNEDEELETDDETDEELETDDEDAEDNEEENPEDDEGNEDAEDNEDAKPVEEPTEEPTEEPVEESQKESTQDTGETEREKILREFKEEQEKALASMYERMSKM